MSQSPGSLDGNPALLARQPMKRQRSKPHSFEDRLAAERKRLEEKAALLRDGKEREALLSKIAQIDTANHLNELLRSPRARAADQDPPRR